MTEMEAIRVRHSVRQYLDIPLAPDELAALRAEVEDCNRESGLHIQLVTGEPKAFEGGMARYGKFGGVQNYFALVGKAGPDLQEKCGCWGERLVLKAQMMGLNTCWVALTFSKVKSAYTLDGGEKLAAVIALGHGKMQGVAHKSKTMEEVSKTADPAPRAFRGADDFGGGGPAFLNVLTGQIVPMVEARLGVAPASRGIAGYSLAGLFALWSVLAGDVFDRAASISGSLWFDGFLEYAASAVPRRSVEQIYLSLGDREKNARNPRLATVEDCTRQAVELLRSRGIPVTFELNQGGHFDHSSARIARGIDVLR